MAAAYFRHLCEVQEQRGIEVDSAGTAALDGEPTSRFAQEVLTRKGIRPVTETSRSLSAADVRRADLIVTMTRQQRQQVERQFPEARGKTRVLLSFAGREGDIEDPYGRPLAAYAACLESMSTALQGLLDQVSKPAGGPKTPQEPAP